MDSSKTTMSQIDNDPFYAKLLLFLSLLFFLIITFYYYLGNPLNIYHFIGLKTIMLTLIIIFFIISIIIIYTFYFDKNDVFYNSKTLLSFFSLFGYQYIYYLFITILIFYVFIKIFTHFQTNPEFTGSLLNYVFYISIAIMLAFSISNFINIFSDKKKGKALPIKAFIDLIKQAIHYSSCYLNDTIKYLSDDLQKTNVLTIYIFVFLILSLFASYIIPKIFIYILLYNGKQLLNSPQYLNKSTHLINYNDLNEEIINTNIFKYVNQYIYDSYNSFVNNQESYINLQDPALSYDINEKLESIKDYIDPTLLEKMIENDPTLVDNIKKMQEDPELMKEYVLSLVPYQGEYMTQVMDYINNLNTIETDKTVDEMIGPSMNYNYNYSGKYNYNYSISFWVFIDNYDGNKPNSDESDKTIIKFGDKLNATYNPYLKQIKVIVKNCYDTIDDNNETTNKCSSKIAYRSKDVLLQKWNHVVMNYDSGTLDIFINNKLVSSTPNIAPFERNDDINIGDNEGIEGAICNVMYFSDSLTKSNVNKIYNFFYTSTPPIL